MKTFWKDYEIVYISSLDVSARIISYTGQINKVPGSVPERQRAPSSGTQLAKTISLNYWAK